MKPKYEWLRFRNQCNGIVMEEMYDNDSSYWSNHSWQDEIPYGWNIAFGEQMIDELNDLLIKYGYVHMYRIVQIKEKFGSLRWYDTGFSECGYEEYLSWLNKYQWLSERTCIICGKKAKMRENLSWISPYCKHHYKEVFKAQKK